MKNKTKEVDYEAMRPGGVRSSPITFRPGPIQEQLDRRLPYDSNWSYVARRDLQRYYKLLEKSVPYLTVDQADRVNEWLGSEGVPVDDIPHVSSELLRRLLRRDAATEVDVTTEDLGVITYLSTLTQVERFALVDALEQVRIFEQSGYSHEGALAVVGLTKIL